MSVSATKKKQTHRLERRSRGSILLAGSSRESAAISYKI